MITGKVRENEVVLRIRVFDPAGGSHDVEAVIDTGFSSSMSLPWSIVSRLKLPWQAIDRSTLGDGSECVFNVYEAIIDWDGELKTVRIHQSETEPLIGMELLQGFEVNFKVRQNGKVTIKRLPKR